MGGYPTDKRPLPNDIGVHERAAVFDMPIRQYLDGQRFDPETTRLLGIAFEFAIQALHNWGVVDPPREAIARAIIGFARAGERDPERLCDLAVEACSKPIITDPSPLPPLRFTVGAARYLNLTLPFPGKGIGSFHRR